MKGVRERILEVYFADRTLTRSEIATRAKCKPGMVSSTLSTFVKRERVVTAARENTRKITLEWKPEPAPLPEPVVAKPAPFAPKPRTYAHCVKFKYVPHVGGRECGEPSNGRPYCEACMAQSASAPAGQRFAAGRINLSTLGVV